MENQDKHLRSNFSLDTFLFIFMSWFYTLCIDLCQFQIVAVMFSANLVCLDTCRNGICRIYYLGGISRGKFIGL